MNNYYFWYFILVTKRVPDSFCDAKKRPVDFTICDQCVLRWEPRGWKPCDVSCGIGHQTRNIVCFRGKYKVSPKNCLRQKKLTKPKINRKCKATQPCPKWRRTNWTDCSTKCGIGHQVRSAICQLRHTQAQLPMEKCSNLRKPKLKRKCKSKTDCHKGTSLTTFSMLL